MVKKTAWAAAAFIDINRAHSNRIEIHRSNNNAWAAAAFIENKQLILARRSS